MNISTTKEPAIERENAAQITREMTHLLLSNVLPAGRKAIVAHVISTANVLIGAIDDYAAVSKELTTTPYLDVNMLKEGQVVLKAYEAALENYNEAKKKL